MGNAAASFTGTIRSFSLLSFITCFLAIVLIQACASQQPEDNYKLTLMEKQVRELEDKMDESYHRLSVLQFMVDNHERTLKDMNLPSPALPERQNTQSRPKSKASPPPSPLVESTVEESMAPPSDVESTPAQSGNAMSASPNTIYNKALAEYKKSDFKAAVEDFSKFIENYPQHPLANNAVYWKGECQYAQKDFQGAITTFKQVLDQYPGGGKVPDALLKTGFAYLSINDKENARNYLKQVVKNYPFSPAGTKAEQMLKNIR